MKNGPLNRTLKARASAMRRDMTAEEFKLWFHFLREYPIKFRRQKVMAPFICDFYCFQAQLVIEVDGSQHYSDLGKSYDAWRSEKFEKEGMKVLRFSNQDIKRYFFEVQRMIDYVVQERLKELHKEIEDI